MKGILILAHGSKNKQTEKILDSIIEKVKMISGEELVAPAFLQFSERDIERGIKELINFGAKEIKVMPMFIFDGVHVSQDIPEEIEKIKKKYKDIKISVTRHIGDDDKLAEIVVDRINSI